ncbi:MAG: glycosyltransferase family 9 protein [Thermodesulfobacteriaceae bacterium]
MNSFFYNFKRAIKIPFCYTAKLYFVVKNQNLRVDELENIIIITPPQNGLGDNIMFSYYIHDLLNNRKDLRLYIVSPYDNFWKLLDYENLHIIYTPKSTMGLYKTLRNINNLFDLAILPSPYIQHIYALFLVNANYKVCYDPLDLVFRKSRLDILGTSNMENCKAYDPYNSFYGELLGNLLRCCGFSVNEKIPKLKNISDYKLSSQKTVVLFVYSKDKLREIPGYFWSNLCYSIIQLGYEVLILYDDEAKTYSQNLIASLNNAVKGLYTDSIERTIQILNSAYAVICPDGGVLHISLLSKVEKIVAFFTVVEPKHRTPKTVYTNKKIKTIQIESPKLKNILSTISSGYKSFFEYKPKLKELYIKEYRKEIERIIKENEKEYINEILEFLKCAE